MKPGERLFLLDGLRGLAAFAVIVDHVPSETMRALIPGRYLAVDFFFVLSGLVLARAYGNSLANREGILRFLKIRLIRLYPLYLLGFLIGLAAFLFQVLSGWRPAEWEIHGPAIISGLLFLPNPASIGNASDVLFPLDPPAWTLFFELLANGLFAILAVHLTRRRLALGLLLCALWAVWTLMTSTDFGAGWQWRHFDSGLSRVMFSFFLGVGLHGILSKQAMRHIPVFLPILALGFILTFPAGEMYRRLFDSAAMLVLIPATVIVSARTQIAGRMAKLCSWLGLVSYGVYILHVPVLYGLQTLEALAGTDIPGVLLTLLVAILSAILTQLAIVIYERPLQKFLRAHLLKTKAQTPGKTPRAPA